MEFSTLGVNSQPLQSVGALGYNHIGDIDIFESVVYAPVEEDSYTRPAIVLYNETDVNMGYLKYFATKQMHMPWVAVDSRTRYLFSSEFDNVTSLYVYQVDNLQSGFTTVNLTLDASISPQGLMAVQGGTISNGYLYLTSSSPGDPVYVVDMVTFQTTLAFNIKSTNETEGIAIGEDGLMYIVVNNNIDATIFQYAQVAL